MFVRTLPDSFPLYERLKKKIPLLPAMISLKCEGHPFFESPLDILKDIKCFYVDLFTSEEDCFCECFVDWPAL